MSWMTTQWRRLFYTRASQSAKARRWFSQRQREGSEAYSLRVTTPAVERRGAVRCTDRSLCTNRTIYNNAPTAMPRRPRRPRQSQHRNTASTATLHRPRKQHHRHQSREPARTRTAPQRGSGSRQPRSLRRQHDLATVIFFFIKHSIALCRLRQRQAMGDNYLRLQLAMFDKVEQLR